VPQVVIGRSHRDQTAHHSMQILLITHTRVMRALLSLFALSILASVTFSQVEASAPTTHLVRSKCGTGTALACAQLPTPAVAASNSGRALSTAGVHKPLLVRGATGRAASCNPRLAGSEACLFTDLVLMWLLTLCFPRQLSLEARRRPFVTLAFQQFLREPL
jgi:hypothetical protein